MKHLIYAEKSTGWVGAFIDLEHGKLTADDYADLYRQFAVAAKLRSPDGVCLDTLYRDQQRNGVYWSEWLGQQGMNFCLFALPDTKEGALTSLRSHLRKNRDVANISSVRIRRLIEFKPHAPPFQSKEAFR